MCVDKMWLICFVRNLVYMLLCVSMVYVCVDGTYSIESEKESAKRERERERAWDRQIQTKPKNWGANSETCRFQEMIP